MPPNGVGRCVSTPRAARRCGSSLGTASSSPSTSCAGDVMSLSGGKGNSRANTESSSTTVNETTNNVDNSVRVLATDFGSVQAGTDVARDALSANSDVAQTAINAGSDLARDALSFSGDAARIS